MATGNRAGTIVLLAALMATPADAQSRSKRGAGLSYQTYADVLKAYVNARGRVNYKGLKANRRKLDLFMAEVGRLSPKTVAAWPAKKKIAFWINVYNARTLQAIIDHYPIKASWSRRLLYPKNSIRQIPGVWDGMKFRVMRKPMTLNDVEHEILRKQFSEPRIHMALVCASIGCPFLRTEPFVAERLGQQLDEQAKQFVSDRTKFRIDRGRKRVYISEIFKWFGADFLRQYKPAKGFAGQSDPIRAALNFQAKYLRPQDRQFLENETYKIEYLDYDWSLNEQ